MAVRAALHEAGVHDEVAASASTGTCTASSCSTPAPAGRAAITWADQRSAALIAEIEARVGVGTFLAVSRHRPAAGFMAPTLAWLARHEPERLDAAAVASCPRTTCACG